VPARFPVLARLAGTLTWFSANDLSTIALCLEGGNLGGEADCLESEDV